MNRFEKIKNMNLEQMADFIMKEIDCDCQLCAWQRYDGCEKRGSCFEGHVAFLKEECEEE